MYTIAVLIGHVCVQASAEAAEAGYPEERSLIGDYLYCFDEGMHSVLQAILVFAFSLIPSLLSLWLMRKAEARTRAGLRTAMEVAAVRELQRTQRVLDGHYIEGVGYLVGDITCKFNARSAYIRCAVNPFGPCEECSHYQPKEF